MYKKILILLIIIIILYVLNRILSNYTVLNEKFVSQEESYAVKLYNAYFDIDTIKTTLNGNWTTPVSQIVNNTITNIIVINIITFTSGTITVPNVTDNKLYDGTVYNILYINQDVIRGNNGTKDIMIETCEDICPTMSNDAETRVISIYDNSNINVKFMSVNINTTDTLTETDINNINNFTFPTTIMNANLIVTYDTEYYYKILGSYIFPSNVITFKNTINEIVKSDITEKLYNRLYISIARCFMTVTKNIIQTKISPPILYNIQNNILPDLITISSFSKDKEANTDIDFGAFTYVGTNIFVYVPTVEYKYYYPESSIQLFDSSNLIFKQGNNYPSLSSTTKETIFYYKPYFYDTVQTNDINKVITFQVTKLPNI